MASSAAAIWRWVKIFIGKSVSSRVGPDPQYQLVPLPLMAQQRMHATYAMEKDGKREFASFRHRIMMGYVHVLYDAYGGTMELKNCPLSGLLSNKMLRSESKG